MSQFAKDRDSTLWECSQIATLGLSLQLTLSFEKFGFTDDIEVHSEADALDLQSMNDQISVAANPVSACHF